MNRPPTRRHGAAADLPVDFVQLLERLGEQLESALPEGKSFALFVIHHPSHEVSLISPHTPTDVAHFLADWFRDRKPSA